MTVDASTSAESSTITSTSSTTHAGSHEGVHLVILHHGLWGNKGHVKFIADQFKERVGGRILVYRAESNESSLTYDGIDICAQRAVQEIHEVIQVIEAGGNIKEWRGQKKKDEGKKQKRRKRCNKESGSYSSVSAEAHDSYSRSSSSAESSPSHSQVGSRNSSSQDLPSSNAATGTKKKVTQFSYIGYSLGGLIGRFAVGLLDQEKLFDPIDQGGQGVEPMYFVTMATPHLGIRKPSESTWSKTFNFLSSHMLSRTGEQLQFIDDYIHGKPLLLVMSEPDGVFVKAVARFKRRAVYCNIKNDRSVPFWTASFSDADPFSELESMEIQYDSGYSSVIESFEHHDLETLARLREKREADLKNVSYTQRATDALSNISWTRVALVGLMPILVPVWLAFASTTIGYQGMNSRKRTRNWAESSESLQRIREKASTANLGQYKDDDDDDGDDGSIAAGHDKHQASSTKQDERNESRQGHTVVSVKSNEDAPREAVSYSFPELKSVKPLPLHPIQVEISRNLNQLEWNKHIIHIEGWNAHASIVVREKRFSHNGGTAAVQHAVDMFKNDGEDE
ncbi:putative serine esterase-domain-containing protein [Mortierella sp. GBAus27b]|nr:hypothetical protein BGX31_006446 [Mortierella sp. GBA43]KAI8362276.1 putative serine esterase-domain-containing protein [Mortierella sp. GBAus27b]